MTLLLDSPSYRVVALTWDLLEVSVRGRAEATDVEEFFDFFKRELEHRAPVRLVTDVSRLNDLSMGARWEVGQHMKKNRRWIWKSAVYGLTPRTSTILSVLVRFSGRDDLKVASARNDALRLVGANPSDFPERQASNFPPAPDTPISESQFPSARRRPSGRPAPESVRLQPSLVSSGPTSSRERHSSVPPSS